MTKKNPHAVALGRKGGKIGGKSKSAAKLRACRRNVKRATAARLTQKAVSVTVPAEVKA